MLSEREVHKMQSRSTKLLLIFQDEIIYLIFNDEADMFEIFTSS